MIPYLELVRFELVVALKTRRALAMAVLYVGAAVLGALVYSAVVRSIAEKLAQERAANPMADVLLSQITEPLYALVAAFFTGVSPAEMAPVFRDTPLVMVIFFSALVFIPYLVVMTTFDQIAADVQTRTVYYPLLRTSRTQVLLAKVSAHVLFFTALSAVASLVVALVVGLRLGPEHVEGAPLGLLRAWVSLVPVGLFYVSLTALFSSLVRQPIAAMFATFAAMLVLWMARKWEGAMWLSPSKHVGGFWHADPLQVARATVAFVLLAALCLIAARWVFSRRDLT